MHNPLDQFKVKDLISLKLGILDLSITNSALFMIVSVAVICLVLNFFTKRLSLAPSKNQILIEKFFTFLSETIKQNIGKKSENYFPFIFAIFLFIASINIIGLAPYSFTSTSQIIVTFSMAMIVFLFSIFVGLKKHGLSFFRFFCPDGLPAPIIPFFVLIEFASFLFRPVSLGIRLFANMVAGHVILKIFASFCVMVAGITPILSIFPFFINCLMYGFELLVAVLQAYVFALLSCIYIKDMICLH